MENWTAHVDCIRSSQNGCVNDHGKCEIIFGSFQWSNFPTQFSILRFLDQIMSFEVEKYCCHLFLFHEIVCRMFVEFVLFFVIFWATSTDAVISKIIMDAGSTSTRIYLFIYKEGSDFQMIKLSSIRPGIQDFVGRVHEVLPRIERKMIRALEHVGNHFNIYLRDFFHRHSEVF